MGIPSPAGTNWLTLGDTHDTPVANDTLEVFHAEALPPGDYLLRLIVIKDSNYVGEPHTIEITVVAGEGDPGTSGRAADGLNTG